MRTLIDAYYWARALVSAYEWQHECDGPWWADVLAVLTTALLVIGWAVKPW